MIFADLIFPVFFIPYLEWTVPWIIPLALLAEAIVFWTMCRSLGGWKIASGTLAANAFSWFVGIIVLRFVPVPLIGVTQDSNFQIHYHQPYLAIAFLIAFGASTLLEFPIWLLVRWKQKVPCVRSTIAANAASYLVLMLCLFILNGFSFEF